MNKVELIISTGQTNAAGRQKPVVKKCASVALAIEKAKQLVPDVIIEYTGSERVWQLNRVVKSYRLYKPNAAWTGMSPGKQPIGNIYG